MFFACASTRECRQTDSGRSEATTARDKAPYVMIPIGLAGIPVGVYNAATGYPPIGALVAVIGVVAAALAIYKLAHP
jgi:hypothetical protein